MAAHSPIPLPPPVTQTTLPSSRATRPSAVAHLRDARLSPRRPADERFYAAATPPHPGPLPASGERESSRRVLRTATNAVVSPSQPRSLSPFTGRGTG